MELVVPPVDNSEVIDDISRIKQQQQEAGRKRTVSKTKSTTSSTISRSTTLWPEFKIPIPDPDLGILKYELNAYIESSIGWGGNGNGKVGGIRTIITRLGGQVGEGY